jgi:hypothetical protein
MNVCGRFYNMTMHMLPSYFTTTSTRKQKKKNKSKSLIAAEKEHEKFLRRMGIGSRSSVGSEQPPSKRQVVGSSPTEIAKRSVGKPGNPPHLGCGNRRFESSRSDQSFYDSSMAKREPQVYNGERKLLGIATMHKSNMVPVFSKDDAEDIAKMRRG